MDNSSRNIIKFIATITVAALVIMAARYYAESQKVAAPGEVEDTTAKPAPATAGAPVEESAEDPATDPENPDGEIIEEDVQLIMGEPSMNIEQGGSSYYPPQPQTAPQAQDAPQDEPPVKQ
jgi:hypothetical protein